MAAAAGAQQSSEALAVGRRAAVVGMAPAVMGLLHPLPSLAAAEQDKQAEIAALQTEAMTAYNRKQLRKAEQLFGKIMQLDTENVAVWYERRGQVLVDLKQFQRAIQDFDEAERQQPAGYKSLGLLNNRALAYEGLYMWKEADLDYSEAIRLGQALGYQQPYILNSRGNVRVSLGRYAEARDDYKEAVAIFQKSKNLPGAIYAQSNAALCLFQLGDDEGGKAELRGVARRAAGSIDARAALAAQYWYEGAQNKAEENWGWACQKINSGVMVENGPALDGCAQYRDSDWLGRIRRWPPVMVERMAAFVNLQE
jgi:tetratricopeptide (TPR) repeat protein